jgi:hypothetical protein
MEEVALGRVFSEYLVPLPILISPTASRVLIILSLVLCCLNIDSVIK